jgi:hypothetical protein
VARGQGVYGFRISDIDNHYDDQGGQRLFAQCGITALVLLVAAMVGDGDGASHSSHRNPVLLYF